MKSGPDPAWIERIYKEETGEDFLGLRLVSGRITDYLLPGIITITDRARYYSFYSWLLREYMLGHPARWSLGRFIKRREQIFALANIAYDWHVYGSIKITGLNGSRKLIAHWHKYRDERSIPLTMDDYLQADKGGYNDYAGAMESLKILSKPDEESLDLLPNGQKLARAFERAIEGTHYFEQRSKYDHADAISITSLREYAEACHLDLLARGSDQKPLLEVLFAFNVPHRPTWNDPERENLENMRGSLGLMLEMLDQAQGSFGDDDYRQTIAYADCADFESYRPSNPLRPFLAHWRMFQLREYYVYALYAFWVYLLQWLSENGPAPFSMVDAHLAELDLKPALTTAGLHFKPKQPARWQLRDWFDQLLTHINIQGDTLEARCKQFAGTSQTPLNAHRLYHLIQENQNQPETFLGLAWLLLSALFLRLKGMDAEDEWNAWYWAKNGGLRRRSLALFLTDLFDELNAGQTICAAWGHLLRDYIVSQHILSALEKWRSRQVNTFHFNYEQGVLQWVRFDENALGSPASRFYQASVVLSDLGLYKENDEGVPQLTALGKDTLARTLENIRD